MKKLFIALVILALFTGVACAESAYYQDSNRRISTAVVTDAGAISTTTIGPSDLILGWTISPQTAWGASVGAEVALYDCSSSPTTSTIIAEAEVTQTTGSVTMMFPYPKQITTALYVGMYSSAGKNTNQAVVTIYYENK